jgi:hypothetical protein
VALIVISGLTLGLPSVDDPFPFRNSGSAELVYQRRELASETLTASHHSVQREILTLAPGHPGKPFALGAVGLSVETAQLSTENLSMSHHALVALMKRLGPGSLRLGGNSLDYSWWTSDDEKAPAWATSIITPSDLLHLRSLLVATGWRAILGVDLGHFEPTRAADEASVAEKLLGARLLGLEIGNEPDSYGATSVNLRPKTYSETSYIRELESYSTALHASVPGIRVYGPDSSSESWLPMVASDQKIDLAAVTQHYYPTMYSTSKGACKGTPVPTALDLLAPKVREEENIVVQLLVAAGQIAHRETRISETNTTGSCDANGGPETSPVFASALWAFDWILRSASAGVAGINFHSNFGLCGRETFSPLCAAGDAAAADGVVSARPEYYGLLAARELENGRFIPVYMSSNDTASQLTAYAVRSRNTVKLAIDDLAPRDSTVAIIRIRGYSGATSERLAAPSIDATSGVMFGDASFTTDGILRPMATKVREVAGVYRLTLAPESAVVVTLHRRLQP